MEKKEREQNKKILLIDDDKFLLDMYSMKFKNSGFDVDVACSAFDALNKVRDGKKYDIFLVDVVMPGMDGLSMIETMEKERKDCKERIDNTVIIILSNQSQLKDVERGNALGVNGFIVKANSIPSEVVQQVTEIWNQNQIKNKK